MNPTNVFSLNIIIIGATRIAGPREVILSSMLLEAP
jgi:hypothetical protein